MPAGDGGVAYALFISKDRRIPKIRIQTRQLGNLLNKRIIVTVDSWDRMSRYPSGHYVRTIGEIGDRDTESEVGHYACLCFLACSVNCSFFLTQELCLDSMLLSTQMILKFGVFISYIWMEWTA